MSEEFKNYLIRFDASILEALKKLNSIKDSSSLTLYVYRDELEVIGSLTDGDIRRSLIEGYNLIDSIDKIMNIKFKFLNGHTVDPFLIKEIRNEIESIPVLTNNRNLKEIISFKNVVNILPVHAIIMAGGRGERLRPLTDSTPKPLLNIGKKPIIRHVYDRLKLYGIKNITITLNYLADQIREYFLLVDKKIEYLYEDKPLGTAGSLSKIEAYKNEYILLTNSDLFTNIDLENLYFNFIESKADMIVASIPYTMNIPYAIFDENNNAIKSFKEKPIINNYANAGIYLFKKELINLIPKNQFFNTTDFMQIVIDRGYKIIHNPIMGYWIDIGRIEDFNKANELCIYMEKNY